MTKRKTIIVTGGTGLLGSTLIRLLEKTGHNVKAPRLELTDRKAVMSFADSCSSVDWIVHTSAMTDVERCEREQRLCYSINVGGTRHIRELARQYGAKLLYISTVSVFSGKEGNYRENDMPYPTNFYSLTKLLGEEAVQEYPTGIVLRLNLVGIHPNGPHGRNLMEWLVNCAEKNKNMKLFTDIMVNPLSNWTAAHFISTLIAKEPDERILHLGTGNVVSKADIGKQVLDAFPSYRGGVEFESVGNGINGVVRPKETWLNTEKAEHAVGLKMPTVQEEVKTILANYKY